jgi:hypothetical protein
VFAYAVCGATANAADCPLDGFGAHAQPPTPFQPPPVSDNFGSFSFGSDIFFDPKYNNYYSWNYIKNEGSDDLPVEWKKVQISQIDAPLGVKKTTCKFIPISVTQETTNYDKFIDKNAPIAYSSAPTPHVQPAWIYIDPPPPDHNNDKQTGDTKSAVPYKQAENTDKETHHDLINEIKKSTPDL